MLKDHGDLIRGEQSGRSRRVPSARDHQPEAVRPRPLHGSPDLSQVVIPNRKIVGEILHNYGRIRQIEITVNVSRTADLNQMLTGVAAVVRENARVLKEPAPLVGVSGFSEGTIVISARPWVGIGDVGAAAPEGGDWFL